ncbi:MAG TPA: D-aminoacyl-tRNA deacylase [Myxococcota bacterium]|nr:D-aminoacyl-tRNA deacylase [Myxococcota bacterium]
MRAVAQRVSSARISVDGEEVGALRDGLLVLVGIGSDDTHGDAQELARKLVHLRVFADAQGRMNRSLLDVGGTLGLVSQFTLFGDARQGRRPSFTAAAAPDVAQPLFERLVDAARAEGAPVVTGVFGSHMQVSLVNDGPVTLLIDTRRTF